MRHLPRLLIATILIIITTAVVAKAQQQMRCSFYDNTGKYQGQLKMNIRDLIVQHKTYPLKCMNQLSGVFDYINDVNATVTFELRKPSFRFSGFRSGRGCSDIQNNQLSPVGGVMELFAGGTQMLIHIQASWKGDILTEFSPQRITIGRDTEYVVRDCKTSI